MRTEGLQEALLKTRALEDLENDRLTKMQRVMKAVSLLDLFISRSVYNTTEGVQLHNFAKF